MEFDNEFAVKAPIDEVWSTLLDVERVAPCVPGAEVLEQTGDDAYKVAIKVKLGPISMQYRGGVEIVEKGDSEHRAVMRAQAKEARGQGTANATVQTRLFSEDGETRGTIHTDLQVRGRAAAMGRGVMQDVAAKLVDSFAANLEQMLEGAPAAAGNGAEPRAEAAAPEAAAARERATAEPEAEPTAAEAPPKAAPGGDEELPLLDIVGSVAADRLRDPRVLVGLLAAVGLIGYLLGRRSR